MEVTKLSAVEVVAARMFFDVAMQSAFALEDPNSRFAQVFEHKDAMGPVVATLADVPARTYNAEIDGTTLLFQVRPPNSMALSRVLVQGEQRKPLIAALEKAMEEANYFDLEPLGSAEPVQDLSEHAKDVGNFMYRLKIHEELGKNHDVAVIFAWGLSSDKGTMMELSAWPTDKNADTTV